MAAFPVAKKNLENRLDYQSDWHDIIVSMPAEPLGFFGNLMLNSGGFFCAPIKGRSASV